MVGPNSLTIDKEMTILQGTASGESMFYLTSGYIGMEYLTSDPLYSSRSFNARHTNLVVNGAFSVGYLYASEGALGVTITIDTRDCFLPVSCRETIIVESGFSFTTDKKLKFLAGSSLVIKENGTFNINNEVIFHKSHSILKNATNSIYYGVLETTSIADAKLLCNGLTRFNSASGSKGALGAYVEHNSTTGNAVFDTQNLGSDAKLTVTDVEGSGSVSVIVTTTGPFETEVAQFSYGTSYTSANSASNYYWEGDFVSTYDVTVQIASGVTNGVVQYTIQSSESSDGSNATDTTLVDATTAGTTSIPRGRYLKIVLTRGQSAVIKDPSGNVITNNYTDIVLVNKNLTVVITPNETYTVQMINSLADGAQSNGRGHVDFEIWECKTQNGTYSKVFSSHCIEFTERVSQGSYFYMVRKFDNNIYNYYKNENAEITKNPSGGTTPSNWNLSSTQQSPKYYADANYVFQTYWTYGASGGGGCVTPETLVTMADGSQKQIQYVTQGEMIQVFNHETGQIDVAPVTFNEHDEASLMTVNTLRFSDGSSTEYIYEHGYFDVDLREYVYFQDNNAEQYIGHRFLKIAANGAQQTVSLVSVAQEERWTDCYELPSFYHLNFIADGFLSMPGGIKGLFNIFELDENFKYDEVKKAADIAQYGLFTREELAEYGVDDLTYDAYPAGYLKVSIGKGIMTEDDLMYLIERYGKYTK